MAVMLIVMSIILAMMIVVMIRSADQYNMIVQNLVTASDFNFDFKQTLDYKMYQYVIGDGSNFDTLNPMKDVENAMNVVAKLRVTTNRTDSFKRLQTIDYFLHNLKGKIIQIRQMTGYEEKITSMDYDIRILTELVQEKVQEYIFYETSELAIIRQRTNERITRTILIVSGISITSILLLWIFSFGIARSIALPIRKLAENIRLVGRGDFTVRAEKESSDEIQALNDTFDSMVEQIETLLENVKEKQQNLRQTELKLLQAQINPHFLYNTFDTIIYLAEDNQNEQVIELVTSLSNFFRTSLSKGEDFITLREEREHVLSYLEIQQSRYRDILDYEIALPDSLMDYKIPKLTLQPLVENALYHGIKNKRGGGMIRITGWKEADELFLQVSDNGIGIEPERLEKLNKALQSGEKIGVGIANVKERIRLYYGDAYGLIIQSEYGRGTIVTVNFPLSLIQCAS